MRRYYLQSGLMLSLSHDSSERDGKTPIKIEDDFVVASSSYPSPLYVRISQARFDSLTKWLDSQGTMYLTATLAHGTDTIVLIGDGVPAIHREGKINVIGGNSRPSHA